MKSRRRLAAGNHGELGLPALQNLGASGTLSIKLSGQAWQW